MLIRPLPPCVRKKEFLISISYQFDGCRLIRPIGSGGFGEVWLAIVEKSGVYCALKFIPDSISGHLGKELHALQKYKDTPQLLECPYIIPIVHADLHDNGLYYVMPLGDGYGGTDQDNPTDPEWEPITLSMVIRKRRQSSTWLSIDEIRWLIIPIVEALQIISNAGLVHRDVKPDNILFVDGVACLGDISLLGDDSSSITQRGTPGFSAPSWFLESGGHPDMYGIATTLYSLLTGNPPDKLGRAAFLWPPQGESSLSETDKREWNRLHRLIRRAIDDRPAERFTDFEMFRRALMPTTDNGEGKSNENLQSNSSNESEDSGKRAANPETKTNASFTYHSAIPWIPYDSVINILQFAGFQKIPDTDPSYIVFRKQMIYDGRRLGVAIGIAISPSDNLATAYACVRVSTEETIDFDNRSFEEGCLAIFGTYLSAEEWNDFQHRIDAPLAVATHDKPFSEFITFQGIFLKITCEFVISEDGIEEIHQSLHVSSIDWQSQ
jgi:serine/threonine protein kinase